MPTYTRPSEIEGYAVTLTCEDPGGKVVSVFVHALGKSYSLEQAKAAILAHKKSQEAQPLPELQPKPARMRLR